MGGFFPYGSDKFGGSIATEQGEVTANTDISVGDALTLSSGRYALMTSGGRCDGVAAESVTGASGVTPKIAVWLPNQQFKVITETTAPAITHTGTLADISTETTGAYAVNPGSSSNDDFNIEGIVQKRPSNVGVTLAIGDEVYGRFVDTKYNI